MESDLQGTNKELDAANALRAAVGVCVMCFIVVWCVFYGGFGCVLRWFGARFKVVLLGVIEWFWHLKRARSVGPLTESRVRFCWCCCVSQLPKISIFYTGVLLCEMTKDDFGAIHSTLPVQHLSF